MESALLPPGELALFSAPMSLLFGRNLETGPVLKGDGGLMFRFVGDRKLFWFPSDYS